MTPDIFLSVVIPAYNEEKRITETFERISGYLDGQAYNSEIIVVDDGSSDQTVPIVRSLLEDFPRGTLLQNGRNRGKGYSVRQGVLTSVGQFVLFCDADLPIPVEEVSRLLAVVQGDYSIAIGSRGLKSSDIQIQQPWYRGCMSKTFNTLLRLLALSSFHDTQCGFKCFRGEVARELFALQTLDHYSFDVEVLLLAQMCQYRVLEVPVRLNNKPNGRVHVIHDSARMLKDVLKIRYKLLMGKTAVTRVSSEAAPKGSYDMNSLG
jgi:dolichyl-phosphate beta-glucosyltransferase